MAHDHAVHNRYQGQEDPAVRTKCIDDSAFLFLTKSLSIHFSNGLHVARLLVSDFDHVIFGLPAERPGAAAA
jgi:hypothetical protein